ncbi:MAG: response regulator [Acidobacteriota bacterium]
MDRYVTAEDAIRAIRLCGVGDSPVPDLLLLDYNLPGGRGVDILAAAAGNSVLDRVPKVILSSFLSSSEMEEAISMGAIRFLEKPATLQEFVDSIGTNVRQLLGITNTQPPAA